MRQLRWSKPVMLNLMNTLRKLVCHKIQRKNIWNFIMLKSIWHVRMLLHPFDHGDQTILTFTGELVRCGFVTKILRFLGFLKEFDILTGLWQRFFCVLFVWKEWDYIMEIRVKKMGFECAIGPPMFTWVRHFPG